MRTIRLVVALCIVLIGALSLTPQQQVISQTKSYTRTYIYTIPSTVAAQLPSLDVMKRFVTTLIDSYTILVNQNDKSRKDFNAIKGYFTFYHDNSSSFNVTAMQTYSYYTTYVTLIFSPIEATKLNVIIDRTNTFQKLFPNCSLSFGFLYTLQRNYVVTEYNGNIVRFYAIMEIALGTFSSSSDYISDANQIAQDRYNYDHGQLPTVSQTQTVTQTFSATATTSTQNWLDWLNPLSLSVVSIVSVIAVVFLVVIPAFFGSVIDFARFLASKEERKKTLKEFRRLSKQKKKQKNEEKT